MKKFWIKRIVGMIFIILIVFVIFKSYHFVIVHRAYDEVKKFMTEKNRYYFVIMIKNGEIDYKEQIFKNNNQIKYLRFSNISKQLYYEFRDFNRDEKYSWTEKEGTEKITNENEQFVLDEEFITCIPITISRIYGNGKLNIKKLFDIRYITLDKYEEKKCYKIVTKSEIVMIDKETYLPVYVCKNLMNSDGETFSRIEYIYEFEVGNVTDENMEMP